VKEEQEKWGPIKKIYLPTASLLFLERCIYIHRPKDLEILLKTNFNNFEKGRLQREIFQDLLGDGIFNLDGELWRSHRKIASHKFSLSHLKNYMFDIFVKHTMIYMDKIKHLTGLFDIQRVLFDFTMDTILEIGLGVEGSDTLCPDFGIYFDNVQARCQQRFYSPFWKLERWLNIGEEKKVRKYLCKMNQSIQTIIENHQGEGNDILSQFMKSDYMKSNSNTYLRDVVVNFMVAGRDTTASALTWAIYELGRNPEILHKLRTELNSKGCTMKSLQNMRYLDGFIHEILRLYPPISVDCKVCIHDTILSCGEKIRKNDRVFYVPLLTGQQTSIWVEPDEIIPERWYTKTWTQFEFPIFNAGYRLCLGKPMALLEMKVFLYFFITIFDVDICSNKIKQKSNITLNIDGGLWVKTKILNKK
jgi:cytochrome P450